MHGLHRGTRRSARTPLTRRLRGWLATSEEAERTGVPIESVREEQQRPPHDNGLSRRRFLAGAGALGAGWALGPLAARAATVVGPARTAPRIAIVGAGLAGLRCAHLLWNGAHGKSVRSSIYEGHESRVGGRCWTLRDYFSHGLITEHGGAFIDSDQFAALRLADELGLQLEVYNGGELPAGHEVYWFDGGYYTYEQASDDWEHFGYRAFHDAVRESATPHGQRRLDRLSAPEWLDETKIGSSSRFGRLMLANTVSEYGGDPGNQSALNLIGLTGVNPRSSLDPLPGYDEKFHVVGGNDQLVSRMVQQLPEQTIHRGHRLTALRENGDGSHTLTFDVDGVAVEVVADFVVLALPFSTLRDVDLRHSGLTPAKRHVIDTYDVGSNAKIHVELARKTWPRHGFNGVAYTDWEGFDVCWDDSVPLGPGGAPALLLGFPGARPGRDTLTGVGHGPAPPRDVEWFLRQVEPIFPGTRAAYTGTSYEDHWSSDRWVKGAYSYFRVGQASSYGHIAALTEGRIHFAGEHTSIANQGFLDGAIATGGRAAREILGQL